MVHNPHKLVYKKALSDTYRIDQIMNDIDLDHDGEINYQEFFTVCIDRRKIEIKSFLEEAFVFFDNDKDGQITLEELKNSFPGKKDLDEEIWKEMLNEVDENSDDKVNSLSSRYHLTNLRNFSFVF